MDNLAKQIQDHSVVQETGIIIDVDKDRYQVETCDHTYDAGKAVSCLIKPVIGDKVLLAGNFVHGFYILAILEREEKEKNTLSFNGDVELKLENGRLTIAAQEGMSMASAKDLTFTSSEFNVHCLKGEVNVNSLLFKGSFWLGQVEKLKIIAHTFDSVVDRLFQRIKRSYRRVEELDQLRAGRLDYLVEKVLSMRGKYSMFTAKEDVKIDGERIHMG